MLWWNQKALSVRRKARDGRRKGWKFDEKSLQTFPVPQRFRSARNDRAAFFRNFLNQPSIIQVFESLSHLYFHKSFEASWCSILHLLLVLLRNWDESYLLLELPAFYLWALLLAVNFNLLRFVLCSAWTINLNSVSFLVLLFLFYDKEQLTFSERKNVLLWLFPSVEFSRAKRCKLSVKMSFFIVVALDLLHSIISI